MIPARRVLTGAVVVALAACAGSSHAAKRADRPARAVVRSTTSSVPPSSTTTPTTRPPVATTTVPPPPYAPLAIALSPPRVDGVFAIGDSVMLGAAPQLRARGITVDAVESRQWGTGTQILERMAAGGALPSVVVVHLGTNGPFSAAQFDATMRAIGPRKVVFVNAHEPRSWEQAVNATLQAGVARWPNARLVDWNAASTPHPEWFWQDDIHLRPQGAQAYAALVAFAAAH
ncbi:MAG TPA: hypothetical protein VFC33_01245 [Acidimicrobiia bacterium]|nr:hypothetical protein [Acidimicrobiia bacterium]